MFEDTNWAMNTCVFADLITDPLKSTDPESLKLIQQELKTKQT